MQVGKRAFGSHRLADLLVLVVLASFVFWYLSDTYNASTHVLNLVLVVPVSLIVLALCLIEFLRQVVGKEPDEESDQREPVSRVSPLMILFAAYVLTLEWLGFDVGTVLFVASALWLYGERRLHWNIGYAICFAVLVSLLFSEMLPYPMPMLIFSSAY
jgi:hypothetical protein